MTENSAEESKNFESTITTSRTWVLDTSPLLNDFAHSDPPFLTPGTEWMTVPGVIQEIKDSVNKQRVTMMIQDGRLRVTTPDATSRSHVVELAQRTGDYGSLSSTDLSLLSLAYQIYSSKEDNNNQMMTLVSDDYAVQNVSLQLHIPTTSSTQGSLIKDIRHFLWRCHACYWMTTRTDKEVKFCGKCGNYGTLCKTSYSVDAQTGQRTLHMKVNYQYNLRGTKYSLPRPSSKPEGTVILREDQREYQRYLKQQKRKELKRESEGNIDNTDLYLERAFGDGFRGLGDLSSSSNSSFSNSGNKGIRQAGIGLVAMGRRNPNSVSRRN